MPATTTTGRRLGRYHLAEPLGGGPCGEVYRAKVYGVAGFERQFAVKRFHPELVATPVVPQRLSTAARAYGSLEHPRIARLHEYGVAGGEVFTATELVAGLDVMRLIAATHGSGAPLPPGAALALATQAARAIGYAHGRGLAHLGICPTNVIVTPDGDVKITDFGMLAQTLTVRVSDDPRLVHRIHHLSPEQLVGEAASAASDVFQLGALIHELVTGERAFVGVTPLDVEHAILSGHVRDTGLPKAMQRVLSRCFARSPYERFPDARALADAIDAALRVTPVSGGRRELGALVKDAVARLDAMNDGQLSGAMMIAMPMPPGQKTPVPRRPHRGSDQVTQLRDPVAPPATPRSKPLASVPAIPSPRVAPAQATLAASPGADARRGSPTRPPPISTPAVLVPHRIRATQPPPVSTFDDDTSQERTLSRESSRSMSPSGQLPAPPSRMPNASPLPFPTPRPEELSDPVSEPLTGRPGALRLDSAWPTGEEVAIPDGSEPLTGRPSEPLIEMRLDDDSEGVPVLPPIAASARLEAPLPTYDDLAMDLPGPDVTVLPATIPRRPGRAAAWLVVFLFVCTGLGVGVVLAWDRYRRDEPPERLAAARDDDEPTPPPEAVRKTPAAVAIDAGAEAAVVAAAIDAGVAQVVPDAPDEPTGPEPTGDLKLTTEPAKALIYIDGKNAGKAPLRREASPGKHQVAVFLDGRALVILEMTLQGEREIELPKVTPTEGDAGLKVKCRKKKRYYVFVDGAPTGQLCPTEEIELQPGHHVVELYDLETQTRQQFPITVKASRNSYKLVVD